MNITIIAVGKVKEKYATQGIKEFVKRLGPYAKVKIVEVADEPAPESLSEKEELLVKQKEGEKILSKITPGMHVVALDLGGKERTSEQFAEWMDDHRTYGRSKLAFVIGGSLGLSEEVLRRADEKVSFSKMTFPHQLMRLFLVEQIYRAFRIIHNEPYHK